MKKFLLALSLSALAVAQTTSSLLAGTITDPAGAAIPRASVAATNVETGVSFKSVTGAQGEYGIPGAAQLLNLSSRFPRPASAPGVVSEVKLDAAPCRRRST